MTELVKSADRVLQILDLLPQHPDGLTLSELCSALGIPKSSTHALVSTMMARQFLVLDEGTRRYRAGLRLWQAAHSFPDVDAIADIALPHMEALRDQFNETLQLALLDGVENVYIAKVDPDQQLRLASRVGVRLPAYATGVGKALLSGLSEGELRRRFADVGFERFTPRTVADVDELLRAVAEVRLRGYAIDEAEHTPGVFCVAVPIAGRGGKVVAGLSISLPEFRKTAAFVGSATEELLATARRISDRLGASSGP